MGLPTSLLIGLAALFVYALRYIRRRGRPSIADIPGPAPESFLMGNLRQIHQVQVGEYEFKWQDEYGPVYRTKASFGENILMISDPMTLKHVMQTSAYDITRQPIHAELMRLLTGKGLLWAEGDMHRRQRKVAAPAFGSAETRSFYPIFYQCAEQLASQWKDIINSSPSQSQVVNITPWLARATMDAIGLAAFDYKFGMLDNTDAKLGNIFNNLLQETHGQSTTMRVFLQQMSYIIPVWLLEWFMDNSNAKPIVRARELTGILNDVAKELVEAKYQALLDGFEGSDLLSLIVKANASEDKKSRLHDEEIYAQFRTLMFAGYESSSNTLSWILFELAKDPSIQHRLREEIRQARAKAAARGDSYLSANDYENMPYMSAVMKEALRMHPVAADAFRQTNKDSVFPLSKPITTVSGRVINELPVPKGSRIIVMIGAYNRNKDVWGEDAHVFNPDRWMDNSKDARNKDAAPVGLYSNLMSFGAGPRSCIGYRFGLAEMQTFLVELIGQFEFEFVEDTKLVRRELALIMVPTLEGQADKGIQLPLRVSLAAP